MAASERGSSMRASWFMMIEKGSESDTNKGMGAEAETILGRNRRPVQYASHGSRRLWTFTEEKEKQDKRECEQLPCYQNRLLQGAKTSVNPGRGTHPRQASLDPPICALYTSPLLREWC